MIKKIIAAVALAFMIIFAGSQSNVAEAEHIYIGYFDSAGDYWGKGYTGYLVSDSVGKNLDSIFCTVVLKENPGVLCLFDFYTEKNTWWFVLTTYGQDKLGGGGIKFRPAYVVWDGFDGKLLNYILNNYDI